MKYFVKKYCIFKELYYLYIIKQQQNKTTMKTTTTQKTGNETTLKIVTSIVGIAFLAWAYFILFVHPGNIN